MTDVKHQWQTYQGLQSRVGYSQTTLYTNGAIGWEYDLPGECAAQPIILSYKTGTKNVIKDFFTIETVDVYTDRIFIPTKTNIVALSPYGAEVWNHPYSSTITDQYPEEFLPPPSVEFVSGDNVAMKLPRVREFDVTGEGSLRQSSVQIGLKSVLFSQTDGSETIYSPDYPEYKVQLDNFFRDALQTDPTNELEPSHPRHELYQFGILSCGYPPGMILATLSHVEDKRIIRETYDDDDVLLSTEEWYMSLAENDKYSVYIILPGMNSIVKIMEVSKNNLAELQNFMETDLKPLGAPCFKEF